MPSFGYLELLFLAPYGLMAPTHLTDRALLKPIAAQGDVERWAQCLLFVAHGHVDNTHRKC